MKSKQVLVIFVFGLFCLSIFSQNDSSKPNVLFIVCDDLNDYQGVFGGHPQAKTPNIDKLAAMGVQFVNAQTNVPVCSPSRNSFITGVYPHVSKDYGWTDLKKQPVLKNNKTIMRLFKENGYTTLGTGKITHGNVERDWDEWGMSLKNNYGPFYFDGDKKTALPTVPSPYRAIGSVDGSYGRLSDAGISTGKNGEKGLVYGWSNEPMRYINDNDRDLMQDELHAKWAVEKINELEKRKIQQPFFMGVGFVRPHTPLHAPDKYFDMFPIEHLKLEHWKADDSIDTYWNNNFDTELKGPRYYRTLLESYGGDRELAIKHFLQAYLACVAFVDEQVGKVINALNESKFRDNTIVIFTSDHGWQMGEKNYLFKNSPWEESARIPLIIKAPNFKQELRVQQPVGLIDLYPTLIDLCDLKGDNKINDKGGDLGGHSLQPLLKKDLKNWKGPNGALTVVGNYGVKTPTEKQNFSYRTKDWRYIIYSNGQEELYNHNNDSYELNNLAEVKQNQSVKRKLKSEVLAILNK
ncbi:MAG: sulfatase [Algibacter sp.]|uniref:sulfatase n=1 Tax=Algibacter sp. TaxID=1872428 RepID=UPI002617C93E|nr:sulfatase [Algibacter sp.]MDG1729159.1 sulfatase [Algibacter sp.]MDG2178416.1 sulfatase [Algibacter sp.]